MKVIPMTSFVILSFEIKSKISVGIKSSWFSTLSNSAFTCNCNLTVFSQNFNYIIRPHRKTYFKLYPEKSEITNLSAKGNVFGQQLVDLLVLVFPEYLKLLLADRTRWKLSNYWYVEFGFKMIKKERKRCELRRKRLYKGCRRNLVKCCRNGEEQWRLVCCAISLMPNRLFWNLLVYRFLQLCRLSPLSILLLLLRIHGSGLPPSSYDDDDDDDETVVLDVWLSKTRVLIWFLCNCILRDKDYWLFVSY